MSVPPDQIQTGSQPTPRCRPTSPVPRLFRVLLPVILVYVGVIVMFAALQRSLIYLPVRTERIEPPQLAASEATVVPVQCETRDGLTLHGWHWKAEKRSADSRTWTVLYFHGNGGNRSHREVPCTLLTRLGADVLIFDYRGYGENDGTPSEEGLALDARAVWEYACRDGGCEPSQLILYGESLGGGVAVNLAHTQCQSGQRPAGVILRSTFDSLVNTGSHHYPWLPVRWLLKDRFASEERIGTIGAPLLFLHGTEDRIVPLERGRQLYEQAPPESDGGIAKRFVEIPQAGHNDLLLVAPETVAAAIGEFLASLR